MIDLLSPLIGEGAARVVLWLLALLIVVALIVLVAWALRRYGGARFSLLGGGRSRAPRLGIVDAMPVDSRRKLVLIRRDNVEHLLLIGGGADLVVEHAIQRTAPATRSRPGDEPGGATIRDFARSTAAARAVAGAAAPGNPAAREEPARPSRQPAVTVVRTRPAAAQPSGPASQPLAPVSPASRPAPPAAAAPAADAPAEPRPPSPPPPPPRAPAPRVASQPPPPPRPEAPRGPAGPMERAQPRFPVPPARNDTSASGPAEPARPMPIARAAAVLRPAALAPVREPADASNRPQGPYFPTNITARPRTTPYAPAAAAAVAAEPDDPDPAPEETPGEAETWPFERAAEPPHAVVGEAEDSAPDAEEPDEGFAFPAPDAEEAVTEPEAAEDPQAGARAGEPETPEDAELRSSRVSSLENEMARLLGEISGRKQ